MRKFRLISLLLICGSLFGREGRFFESANLSGQYLMMMSAKDGVSSASGPGFKGSFRIPLSERVGLEIGLGYLDLDIKQDSALQQWDWEFYNEYYMIRTNNSDESFDILQTPNQQMTVLPLTFTFFYDFRKEKAIQPFINCGLGVYFYKRNFWLYETWGKNYELETGDYYYKYSFNNFADPKKGHVYSLSGAAGINIFLKNDLGVFLSAQYMLVPQIQITKNDTFKKWLLGLEYTDFIANFPLKSLLTISCGINFTY